MAWTNYHTHTQFCDGEAKMTKMLERAAKLGIPSFGFSPHAPLPFPTSWAMKMKKMDAYLTRARELKLKYQGQMEVYAGLEIDYIPGVMGPEHRSLERLGLDYTIGAVHFVDYLPNGEPWQIDASLKQFEKGLKKTFQGDVQKAVSRYFELVRWMVLLETPDVVAHLDLIKIFNAGNRFFAENEEWYRIEIEKTLRVIANMGCIVEVNTRGLYRGKTMDLYPGKMILERMRKLRIPITLSSDAHAPNEVTAGYAIATRILSGLGFTHLTVLHQGKWMDAPFTEDGIRWPDSPRVETGVFVA